MFSAVHEEVMLTIEDVADQLKVSVMTVRRMVGRGEIPAYAIGGQWRFKEAEVQAYIDSQRVTPNRPKNAIRPARPTDSELRKVGVEWRDESAGILGCLTCGQGWTVMLRQGGNLPRNYWRCPNGCNSDENLDAKQDQPA